MPRGKVDPEAAANFWESLNNLFVAVNTLYEKVDEGEATCEDLSMYHPLELFSKDLDAATASINMLTDTVDAIFTME